MEGCCVLLYTLSLVLAVLTRVIWVCWRIWKPAESVKEKRNSDVILLVVAGSGGHTTEILKLTKSLSNRYNPRVYLIAETDEISEAKIHQSENSKNNYSVRHFPRSREVHQSWISTVGTTLYSTLWAIPFIIKLRPDVILCNGPGTCIPVCVAGFVSKVFFIKDITVVYVESICRVTSLSLSGKILYFFSDHFIVQWPELLEKYSRATYLGRLS